MDLEFFLNNYGQNNANDLGNKIGLYVVQQSHLDPRFKNLYRCGAAGTKEVDRAYGGGASSTFRSRLAMYLSNWISGGVILAALTVDKSIFQGFSQKILNKVADDDKRENYAIPGQTKLQFRERQYHAALEERGVKRARSGRAEWFQGSLRQIKMAMKSIGTGEFYEFDKNTPPHLAKPEKLSKQQDELEVTKVTHRTSPRLDEPFRAPNEPFRAPNEMRVTMASKDVEDVRNQTQRGREITRGLQQLFERRKSPRLNPFGHRMNPEIQVVRRSSRLAAN